MTYTPDIPQSTDKPKNSQSQILNNFQQINTIFDENHITFNASNASERGYHDVVTFHNQSADPAVLANYGQLYQKNGPGNVKQLFWRQNSSSDFVNIISGCPIICGGRITVDGALNITFSARSFNVNTVSSARTGVGEYAIDFLKTVTQDEFFVVATTSRNGHGGGNGRFAQVSGHGKTGFTITVVDNQNAPRDPTQLYFVAFGATFA